MATSPKAFLIELYQEYLQEASFLYEQSLSLRSDPEINWRRMSDFENRFEAHIDGLVVGQELALNVCQRRAREGDFGELHAAIRVFCRQKRKDLVFEALKEFDSEDVQKTMAITDALKHELPENWHGEFLDVLSGNEAKLIPILGGVFGYGRLKSAGNLSALLNRVSLEHLPMPIWAIGRLGGQGAREALQKLLDHEDDRVRSASALALMRLGEERAVNFCLQSARAKSGLYLALGLGGGRAAVMAILERCKNGEPGSSALTALGLLGSVSAIPVLIGALSNPEVASPSAMALQAITGAAFSENAFVRDADSSMRPDGKPYGSNVTRISQNPKIWEKWWNENKRRFREDACYRNGNLYSPATLFETLNADASPHISRQLAGEEFVIRYAYDFPFETDMLVSEQETVINKCKEWVSANKSRFDPGKWYFAGRVIP